MGRGVMIGGDGVGEQPPWRLRRWRPLVPGCVVPVPRTQAWRKGVM